MNRLAGIIVAAVGFVLALLGASNITPGMTQPGVYLLLAGGLIIGLSFISGPEKDGTEGERMSTPNTLINIFLSPSETFQNLRRYPRFLVAMLIMVLMSVTFTNLFLYRLTPDRVTNFAIDKTLEMPFLNDEARAAIETNRKEALAQNKDPIIRAGQGVSSFASHIFGYAFFAAVLMLFALAMGGKINYWQAFSAAVYAAFPVAVLKFVLSTLILFIKDPSEIHPILGQSTLVQDNLSFLVSSAENPVIYSILAGFGLLSFYWVWLLATGLSKTGEKVSASTGWTAALTIFGALLLLGVTMALLFPSFIS